MGKNTNNLNVVFTLQFNSKNSLFYLENITFYLLLMFTLCLGQNDDTVKRGEISDFSHSMWCISYTIQDDCMIYDHYWGCGPVCRLLEYQSDWATPPIFFFKFVGVQSHTAIRGEIEKQ